MLCVTGNQAILLLKDKTQVYVASPAKPILSSPSNFRTAGSTARPEVYGINRKKGAEDRQTLCTFIDVNKSRQTGLSKTVEWFVSKIYIYDCVQHLELDKLGGGRFLFHDNRPSLGRRSSYLLSTKEMKTSQVRRIARRW